MGINHTTSWNFYQSFPCIEADVTRRPFNEQLMTKNGEIKRLQGMVRVIHNNKQHRLLIMGSPSNTLHTYAHSFWNQRLENLQ